MSETIYQAIDRETIASLATYVGFTASKLSAKVVYALIQPVDGAIRVTIDGTHPTTSLGLSLKDLQPAEIWGRKSMANFLCVDDGGTATLEVVYMGTGG